MDLICKENMIKTDVTKITDMVVAKNTIIISRNESNFNQINKEGSEQEILKKF